MTNQLARRIVFPACDKVALEPFTPADLGAGQVRMRTSSTLMSTGTEGIALHGLFDPGTHWADWVRYPFHPGYAAIGEVAEVGADVTGLVAGDRIVARAGHASEHVVDAGMCTLVPAEIADAQAVWFALAKIALMGARAARYGLGDRVAIVGAGPIGQMSVRWAVASGAHHVVVIDTVPARLETARRGGATAAVGSGIDDAAGGVVAAIGGRPRVVVDTTGNAAVFAGALGLAADRGTVVVLGDTGSPGSQRLTSDVIRRGVTVVGAHDGHSRTPHGWDGDRGLHEYFFALVASGRFPLDGLTSHTFAPDDCAAAYDVATSRRGDTMGIVFDWTAA